MDATYTPVDGPISMHILVALSEVIMIEAKKNTWSLEGMVRWVGKKLEEEE